MPQGRPTIEEALRQPVLRRPTIDEALARPVIEQQQQPEQSLWESFKIGAAQGLNDYIIEPALALSEAVGSAAVGDFRPLGQMTELAGRGAVRAAGYLAAGAPADPRIAEIQAQQAARRANQPGFEQVRIAREQLTREAAANSSFSNRAARFLGGAVVGAGPVLATGVLTGGSAPAVALTAAAQSAGQPENLALNVGAAVLPIPVGQAGAAILRRLRGARGAAAGAEIGQAVEEAAGATANSAATATQASNYQGKPVTVDIAEGAANGTVEGQVFGRVKVRLDDGRLVTVERGQITPQSMQPSALAGAFQKLGTQDLEEIGNIIENSNRRYRVSSTPEEIAGAQADFERLRSLTPDEHRALGGVLPARPTSPVVEDYTGLGSYSRDVEGIPLLEPNAQIDANLRELETFFGEAAQEGIQSGAANRAGLARAIGATPDDVSNVTTAELGLPSVELPPTRAAGAKPVQRSIPIEDITLGRDTLNRGRMNQVQEALENGVQPGGATYLTPRGNTRIIDPIEVVPDPAAPGKWIVENDGNHRTALLKLSGYTGEVPVTAWETQAEAKIQEAAIQSAGARSSSAASSSVSGPAAPGASLTVPGGGGGPAGSGAGGPRGTGGGGSAAAAPAVASAPIPATPAARTHWLEVLSAMRKAGLLTGVKTHLKNIGGNLVGQGLDEISRIPASIVDAITGVATGRRTITGPSATGIGRSAYEAATDGVAEGWRVIKRGYSNAQANRLQLPQEVNSGSKIIDTYVNGVFRTLGAEDQVFYTYALRRSLEDRAKALALTELKQGTLQRSGFGARVSQLAGDAKNSLQNTPNALAAEAIADAEAATFTETNKLASGFNKFREGLSQPARFGLDLIFPFVKTPTNIVKRMLEYTPGGAAYSSVKAVNAALKGAFTDAEQRAFAQGIGRAATGTALIYLGYKLYEKGLATGFIEDDLTRRARDLAGGRIPGAIKIGGTWLQIAGFAPGGNLVALGATIAREWRQEQEQAAKQGEEASIIPVIGKTTLQATSEQPLVQGSEQIADLFKRPEQAASRIVGGVAGSAVPTIAADLAEAIDSRQRDARGLTGPVLNRIPGVRNTLPPAQDVIGQPRQDTGPVAAFLDPTRATTDVAGQNPVFAELVRLDHGISGFTKKKGETDDAYRARVQIFGNLYTRYGLALVSFPQYQALSDDDKREAFTTLNAGAKRLVTEGKARTAPLALNPGFIIQAVREKNLREQIKARQQAGR